MSSFNLLSHLALRQLRKARDKEEGPKQRWEREPADEDSGFESSKEWPTRAKPVPLKGSQLLAGVQNRRVNSNPSDGLGVLLRVYVEKAGTGK